MSTSELVKSVEFLYSLDGIASSESIGHFGTSSDDVNQLRSLRNVGGVQRIS